MTPPRSTALPLAAEAEILANVAEVLARPGPPQDALRHIVEAACRAIPCRAVALWMTTDAGLTLEVVAGIGLATGWIGYRQAAALGLIGRAFGAGKLQQVADLEHDADELGWFPELCSVVAVPVCLQDRSLGVVVFADDVPGRFGPGDLRLARAFAAEVAVAFRLSHGIADQEPATERPVGT